MNSFIVGDIHGKIDLLSDLWKKIKPMLSKDDNLIFLGDYIDRGLHSFEVVEFLSVIGQNYPSFFLMGNHEVMLRNYLSGEDKTLYFANGGMATIKSYSARFGSFSIPENHAPVLFSEKYYYIGNDFIAVHAGFNPEKEKPDDSDVEEMVWIREKFYKSGRIWKKTIVFGHTQTQYMGSVSGSVFFDSAHNLIGIDTGAAYGEKLSCIIMPERNVIQSDI